jgi:DNA polymerase-3 subunit epsilon
MATLLRPRRGVPWPVDPATSLDQVTFCVLDIETTGSGSDDAITEIGAVKVRGGECLGTFQTLVNPERGVAPFVTLLTGITEAMLAPAPTIHTVLPAFTEFTIGCVLVGHNATFDLGFLDAACDRTDRPRLPRPVLDTLALARHLVRDDVTDCRLATLAEQLRLDHHPCHRALDDALATTDLLHALVERATAWDVRALDDLVHLPRVSRHRRADQVRLAAALPRTPGVYRFVGRGDNVLYVGTATNLRSRVRSYFGSDDRRMVQPLLRATERIEHVALAHPLLAQVLEVRELHRLRPRFNTRGARPQSAAYVHLTDGEPFPRLRVVRRPAATGVHLGPVPSSATAQRIVEALQQVLPLRRCTQPLRAGAPLAPTPCLPAQLGVAACPCAGVVDDHAYRAAVAAAARALGGDADPLLARLEGRIADLAAQRRFEEAALARDRAGALRAACERLRRINDLVATGEQVLALPDATDHGTVEVLVERGRIVHAPGLDPAHAPEPPAPGRPASAAFADEANVIARWLERRAQPTAA